MTREDTQSIIDLLVFAASQVIPAPGRGPWEYGWAFRDYRCSERAALRGRKGPVTLSSDGIDAWEKATTKMLREQRIRSRWDAEEFWGIFASLVVAASEEAVEERTAFIQQGVSFLREARQALTIQLIANMAWGQQPLDFGNAIIGDAGVAFLAFVNDSANARIRVSDELANSWLDDRVRSRMDDENGARPVAIACWTTGQQRLARRETERRLRDIVDLTLLLERDLEAHKIYRRGATNRPGIRGLTLDRGALDRGLNEQARLELASFPLTITARGESSSIQWFGAEPLPLGNLLAQDYLREAIISCLQADPISNRIRVAARWFAEAHYSLDDDDSALALGVAMDALLSGADALPGRAMSERYALLAEEPKERSKLAAEHQELYKVRSSVAHGAQSSRLSEPGFIKDYQRAVDWAAWRSIALRDTFKVSAQKEVDTLYEDLRWGTRSSK